MRNPNIAELLIERVENRRCETKNPCKNYSSYSAANKAGLKFSTDFAELNGYSPIHYVVVFDEVWGRWFVALNINEFTQRPEWRGGFVGIGCDEGFYQF
tara:strand:- start:936 stop:1232 length:297 start_codon:yes stop_codon:yes gene_type:complete